MTVRIIVANRLSDGVVVYLTGNGDWTPRIDRAQGADTDSDTEALLNVAARAARDRIVVDPYPIETIERNGRRAAARLRERIRALGPTVRPDLGRETEARS